MSSTAAGSATAIQVISVQDRKWLLSIDSAPAHQHLPRVVYYNNKMNPGIAIFTLIGSQLLGYGFAGLLQDILVKPTKCFWPINSEQYLDSDPLVDSRSPQYQLRTSSRPYTTITR